MINRIIPLLLFIGFVWGQADYQTQIQTIFNANCTSCHINGGAYQQGLDLSSYDSLMAGSNNGAVIIPGDHANSLLWQKVNSGTMPPGNNPDLNSDEVDLIAQWIDEGALEVNNIDCYADDGTEGVELWGECYSIENTTELDLSNSGLTGSIPPEIGNLTNLTYLYLYDNQLTGSIPPEIGNLINLEYLSLRSNQLTGSIPPEIGNLINLEYLSLSTNQLTGELPSEIWTLTNLEYLNLRVNQFTGEIPPEIGNLTNLTRVSLYDNQLTGEIPPEIWTLTNLEYLAIDGNQLTGTISPEIGELTNLHTLWLSENTFTGSIPSELFTLENLIKLHLFDNQLTGEIPSEIGNLTNLERIQLHTNQLTGSIPETLCNLSNLTWSLEFSSYSVSTLFDNQFCPPYPSCIEDYVGYQDTTNCEQVSIYDGTLPITYNLYNAYPNPFNPVTTLRYDLPENSYVNVTVYDMLGREIRTLVNSTQDAGFKSVIWNATNDYGKPVSAGVYLYQIQAGEFVQTKKMVLLK